MIPPISFDVLLALAAMLRLDVTLLLISGALAVGGALLNLDARNKRRDAREESDVAAWHHRQADRLMAAIRAEDDMYPTVPVKSDEDGDDAPAELGDPGEEQEPTRPLDYTGRRRRPRLTLRQRYERWESRRPFDLADEAVAVPVAELPEPVEVSAPELPLVAAGAVEAEGLDETDEQFQERITRDLDKLFASITVGAR